MLTLEKVLWDKSISLPPTHPCLPSREIEEKCYEPRSFLESKDGGAEDDKHPWLCGLGIAKILHKVKAWPWPWLQAKGVDEKLLCLRRGCQKRVSHTLLQGCLVTRIRTAKRRANLPPDTLTDTWHRHTVPAHQSTQIKHGFTEHSVARWGTSGLGLSHLPDWVTTPGLEGMLPWKCHSEHQQSSCLYRDCVIQVCVWSQLV